MWGSFLAAAGVALGAYSAHGLEKALIALSYEDSLEQRMEWFRTGVSYHLYHALGIMLAGLIAEHRGYSRLLRIAPWGMLVGIVLFSGSLYAMSLAGNNWRFLGAIVPLGGLSFIAGWIALAIGSIQGSEVKSKFN